MVKDKLLRHIDVGGKIIRLIESENYYYMFEDKKLIYKIFKKFIQKQTIWQLVTDYAMYLKKMQKEFIDGKMPIDNLVNEVENKMRKEFSNRLKKFFKILKQKNMRTNKEAFFKIDIFNRLNKVFNGFNNFVDDMVKDVVNKLGVQVVDDVEDTGSKIDDKIKKDLLKKKKLLIKNISSQVKNTKDNILQGIKKDLMDGMQAGEPVSSLQKTIEKKYNYRNGVAWKQKRVLRTELHSADILLKLKKWKAMGFVKAEHLTRADERTCPVCSKLNHKVFEIDYLLKHKDKRNPQHPNCRCTYIVYS